VSELRCRAGVRRQVRRLACGLHGRVGHLSPPRKVWPDRPASLMSAPAPALPADLTAGLRRLKLAAMRQLAPELLLTAKT